MTAIAPNALDHVALWVAERDTLASFLCDHLGMHEIERGDAGGEERPLLNHLALLVDSAQAVNDEAESRGLEIADFVDAENTIAVFVLGPDGIKLEYVEHKPTFSLV